MAIAKVNAKRAARFDEVFGVYSRQTVGMAPMTSVETAGIIGSLASGKIS